jgi:hypothetical protein
MFEKPVRSTAAQAVDLPDNQRLALEALVSGQSRVHASTAAGVSVRTLQRWFHDPIFQSALHQARCEAWSEVTGDLHSAGHEAVTTLREVLNCDQPRARVLAAKAILHLSARALELESLVTRMTQVEADLEAGFPAENPGPASTPPAGSPPPPPSAPKVATAGPAPRVIEKLFGLGRQFRSRPDQLAPCGGSRLRNPTLLAARLAPHQAATRPNGNFSSPTVKEGPPHPASGSQRLSACPGRSVA